MLTMGQEEEDEEEEEKVTERVTSSVYEKHLASVLCYETFKKRLIFVILFSLSVRMMDAVIRMTHRFK